MLISTGRYSVYVSCQAIIIRSYKKGTSSFFLQFNISSTTSSGMKEEILYNWIIPSLKCHKNDLCGSSISLNFQKNRMKFSYLFNKFIATYTQRRKCNSIINDHPYPAQSLKLSTITRMNN